jgi:hypothetical protein
MSCDSRRRCYSAYIISLQIIPILKCEVNQVTFFTSVSHLRNELTVKIESLTCAVASTDLKCSH